MTLPDDLPEMVEYRLGKVVMPALPRRPVRGVGTSGNTDAVIVCPQIPFGATAWRVVGQTEWQPLSAIPPAWLPLLQRERGTEWDCRPKLGPKPNPAKRSEGQPRPVPLEVAS